MAVPVIKNSVGAGASSSSFSTVTFPNPSTAGNGLIVGITVQLSTGVATSLSVIDNNGNTYLPVTPILTGKGTYAQVFKCTNLNNSPNPTLVLTPSGTFSGGPASLSAWTLVAGEWNNLSLVDIIWAAVSNHLSAATLTLLGQPAGTTAVGMGLGSTNNFPTGPPTWTFINASPAIPSISDFLYDSEDFPQGSVSYNDTTSAVGHCLIVLRPADPETHNIDALIARVPQAAHSIDVDVSYPPFAATAKFPGAIAGGPDLLNQRNYLLGETLPTLASSIGPSDTSLTVAPGTGSELPFTNFEVTLEQEIIFVPLREGDICNNLIRGAEGTTAAAHASGITVNAFITALAHNQDAAEINAIETALGVNLANISSTILAAQKTIPCMVEVPGNLANAKRVIGTVYQNTSSFPLLVCFNGFVAATGNVVFAAFVDSSSNPTTQVYSGPGTNNGFGGWALRFFVLPGQFYKITNASGTPTIAVWREFTCQQGNITDSGDLVGSRSLSTVFQNNTPNTMFLIVQVQAVSISGSVFCFSDTTTNPTDQISVESNTSNATNTITSLIIVPPGHYYKVTSASGSLLHWREYLWNIPCIKSTDLLLTTGAGQTRTMNGVATPVFMSTSQATINSQPIFLNSDPFRVRWVQASSQCNGTLNSMSLAAGGEQLNVPRALCSSFLATASIPRTVGGPVMPNSAYSVWENQSNTSPLTPLHWWEYQLG